MDLIALKSELKKKERSLSIALRARYQINLLERILDRALREHWRNEQLDQSLYSVVMGIKTELPIKSEEMRDFERKKRFLLRSMYKIYGIRPDFTYYQKYAVIGTVVSFLLASLFFGIIGDAFIHASWSTFPVSVLLGALVGLVAEMVARKRRRTL